VRIDIWSDVVCPWCYVGKRRLERALEAFDHREQVRIAHRSFQLDPSRPRHQTTSRRAMLKAKYRLSDEQVQEMDRKMERLAAAEGLDYHLTDAGMSGNTLDAHQLVHLGRDRGIEEDVLERLYRAYFSEQRSLFDRESLVDLGVDAGLDAGEVARVLEEDTYVPAVTADVNEARALGISGVPFFVIDGRYAVSGAQSIEAFRQALARAWTSSS
jgi:predicted DsbA family dithiol-disulfide isomerase